MSSASDGGSNPSTRAGGESARKRIAGIEWLVIVEASRTIVAASSVRGRVFRLLPQE
jgi:hypothetical protein